MHPVCKRGPPYRIDSVNLRTGEAQELSSLSTTVSTLKHIAR
jgi:hypothetical protein